MKNILESINLEVNNEIIEINLLSNYSKNLKEFIYNLISSIEGKADLLGKILVEHYTMSDASSIKKYLFIDKFKVYNISLKIRRDRLDNISLISNNNGQKEKIKLTDAILIKKLNGEVNNNLASSREIIVDTFDNSQLLVREPFLSIQPIRLIINFVKNPEELKEILNDK